MFYIVKEMRSEQRVISATSEHLEGMSRSSH
jgi:hypothetical protein